MFEAMYTRLHTSVVLFASLVGLVVGLGLLIAPSSFQSSVGLVLADATALSETRAPGGALVGLSAMTGIGVLIPSFRQNATLLAAVVYLAYGLSRVLSVALDGMPHPGIVAAMLGELAIGAACVVFVRRPSPLPVRA